MGFLNGLLECWPLPADGGIIRHRNFPAQAWQEMGLLRSAGGEYLDASVNTVWSADPDGRGFVGRKLTDEEDVSRFNTDPDQPLSHVNKPRTDPEGFIVENSIDHSAEVVIDQVPAPEPGNERAPRSPAQRRPAIATPRESSLRIRLARFFAGPLGTLHHWKLQRAFSIEVERPDVQRDGGLHPLEDGADEQGGELVGPGF